MFGFLILNFIFAAYDSRLVGATASLPLRCIERFLTGFCNLHLKAVRWWVYLTNPCKQVNLTSMILKLCDR